MRSAIADRFEWSLLDRFMNAVENVDARVHYSCTKMKEDLAALAALFGRFPSILDERSFGRELHSIDTLVDTILNNGPDHAIVLPTKVVVGRALLVCRFNFVGFLVKVCSEYPLLNDFKEDLQTEWGSAMFLLLLEDLYHAIVERHECHSEDLRRQAAVELVHLWEYRSDRKVADYALTIIDLWRVRRQVAPVFGTMLGTVELLRISSVLSRRWRDFLANDGNNIEVAQGLEEFVFGLTHEDVCSVRSAIHQRHLSVIDREMISSILGTQHAVQDMNGSAPRDLYRFFRIRSAANARRIIAAIPGPRQTLEELVLAHFLAEEQRRPT
jgi:hypothetical protein